MAFLNNLSQNKPTVKVALLALGAAIALASALPAAGQSDKPRDRAKVAQETRVLEQRIRAGQSSTHGKHEVSCHPSNYEPGVCPDALIAACDKYGGGMSTNPDGSHTCSGPYTGPQ